MQKGQGFRRLRGRMWLMLQQENRMNSHVIATGELTCTGICRKGFAKLDLDYARHVAIDPRYFRPYRG